MKLESLIQYVDAYLGVSTHPDYPNALNGLQVDGRRDRVSRIAAAVDASEASIRAAIEAEADLLLVHHGLFWDGLKPLTGRRLRRIRPLVEHGVALYAAHLPLDSHAEVGNCILLAQALGVQPDGRFALFGGVPIGWWGHLDDPLTVEQLGERLLEALGVPGIPRGPLTDAGGGRVHLMPGGSRAIERVGVVTGGGGSFVQEAVDLELDALVTGEAAHHTHFDAVELGINVLLGGHYATETFGVKALASHLADRFSLEWLFVDLPTGL
jgi:dinuclear metal center YbgI/SA1388 family protein